MNEKTQYRFRIVARFMGFINGGTEPWFLYAPQKKEVRAGARYAPMFCDSPFIETETPSAECAERTILKFIQDNRDKIEVL